MTTNLRYRLLTKPESSVDDVPGVTAAGEAKPPLRLTTLATSILLAFKPQTLPIFRTSEMSTSDREESFGPCRLSLQTPHAALRVDSKELAVLGSELTVKNGL